ncbi:MAG: hypothetical protein K5653_05130 [Clostridiales bacterium]|nr:hypothetical protein [Clostridiales bacterium]
MKRIMILALCMILCFGMLLTGCGRKDVTAQSLMKGIDLSEDLSCEIGFDLGLSIFGMPIEMSADIDAEMAGGTAHLKGTMESTVVNIFEGEGAEPETETSEFELYALKEGKAYAAYVNDGEGWTRSESEEISADISKLFTENKDYSGFTLTQKGDKYIVTGELKSEQVMESLGEYANDLEEGGLDAEALKDIQGVEVTFTFDASTQKLEAIDIDLSETLTELFEKAANDSSLNIDSDDENIALAMSGLFSVSKLEVHVSNISFEKIGKIEIPQEALNAK